MADEKDMPEEPDCHILLIEDQPDAAKLVQYVLSKGTAPKLQVEWAPDLHSGLERLNEPDFQAVLLDLNLPDSNGFETFARVRQQCGDRAVIVLTAQEDEGLGLQAVRSGADEYLIKSDIRDRFLAQRIRYAIERRRLRQPTGAKAVHKAKLFAFLGAKGGVGTTTLVLNLAAELAKNGAAVTALELTPAYGSFAAHLRQAPAWNSSALLKSGPENITREGVESCLVEVPGGFRALFGPQRSEEYGEVVPENARALLRNAASLADYTLIDLPSFLLPYTAEVIQHAGFVTLIVEQDWVGLNSGSAKLPLLRAAARQNGIGLAIINKTPHVQILPEAELARQLGCGVVGIIPAVGDLLAANHSPLPLVLNRPDAAFSESIREMAQRLVSDPVPFVQF